MATESSGISVAIGPPQLPQTIKPLICAGSHFCFEMLPGYRLMEGRLGVAKWPSLMVSGATGGAVASVIAGLGCAAGHAPFSILAGLACGTAAALAVGRSSGPLCPISDRIRAISEAEKVLERGYQICFRHGPQSKTTRRWTFTAHLRNRTVGRLEVDFIEASSRLFVANVYVVESHRNRGLGTALLLCAAKTTDCRVVTSSSRTRQGEGFFAKARLVLKGYGVEMRDPPADPSRKGS